MPQCRALAQACAAYGRPPLPQPTAGAPSGPLARPQTARAATDHRGRNEAPDGQAEAARRGLALWPLLRAEPVQTKWTGVVSTPVLKQ